MLMAHFSTIDWGQLFRSASAFSVKPNSCELNRYYHQSLHEIPELVQVLPFGMIERDESMRLHLNHCSALAHCQQKSDVVVNVQWAPMTSTVGAVVVISLYDMWFAPAKD